MQGFIYTIDGVYRFKPCGRLAPYALGGIGALSISPNGNESSTQGNINAGIGSQYFIDPSIAFRAEIKDLYTMTGGKNDVMINFGVTFLFGGTTQETTAYKGA